MFDRIVCGVDGTPESLEAVRLAAALRCPGGSLTLVAVADIAKACHAGWAARDVADQIRADCEEALRRGAAITAVARSRLLVGRPILALLRALADERATLVALGAHGHRLAPGLLLGTVGARITRDAPCSVLLARPGPPGAGNGTVLVGLDGSVEAAVAEHVAREASRRLGARLRMITGLGGKIVSGEEVAAAYPGVELDPRAPVDALRAASAPGDLLVVGSSGLHSWRRLGSVGERIAHRAHCSVLLVRNAGGETSLEVVPAS